MAEAAVQIKLLGRFEILVRGKVVLEKLWQSPKTRQFLEYLILKGDKGATHEELLSTLWAERYSLNPATALRTLLHRYRSMVEQAGIKELEKSVITSRGSYRWNTGMDCELDIEQLERLCTAAAKEQEPAARTALFERVLGLYEGPLLPSSSGESWVAAKSAYYHSLFTDAMLGYVELLKDLGDHNRIVQVCRRTLEVDMFDDRFQAEMAMALTMLGKRREAMAECMAAGSAADRLSSVYQSILDADERQSSDMEEIYQHLTSPGEPGGAFVCDFSILKSVYQLQRRILERHCSTMYMAVVGLFGGAGPQNPIALSGAMDELLEVLRQNLRRGDVISRYGANQFVLLLPSATYNMSGKVLERIKRVFYDKHVNSDVAMRYRLKALEIGQAGPRPE